jgi:hypothetical protein
LSARARVVYAIVAAVALWPVAHRALVERTGASPWAFHGFAMYTTPEIAPTLEAFDEEGRPVAMHADRELRRRATFGELYPLSRIADRAPAGVCSIAITERDLDPRSSRIVEARTVLRSPRCARGSRLTQPVEP